MQKIMKTALLLLTVVSAGAQSTAPADERDLNLYYRYPAALSVEFHSWNSFTNYGRDYTVYELGGALRIPVPKAPVVQPLIRGSYIQFDAQDEVDPDRWDHSHIWGAAGVGFLSRLARSFEIGAELVSGYSYTSFPNLTSEPVGYGNLIAAVSPRITLLPSFNLAVTVQPTLRYSHALGAVDTFDGLSFSVGIAAEYRFGQDPDAPQAEIRSLRISQPQIDTVFAAMQSFYVNNPVGTVEIENTESFALTDVQVSFFQRGFMDSPTPSLRLAELGAGQSTEVDLLAAYNSEVFSTEGITPLTGEIIVTYSARGRPAEQRESVTYDLRDKTALTWTDDRKMGSFITPADSAIQNYTSFIRQAGKDSIVDSASEPVQVAMLAYLALEELGVIYQVDPASPFTQVQNNTQVVDSVNLPRATLRRLAGDCDDLTALYATMLETVGIETAFLTTPGHIYVAFNTGVPARDYRIVHPDRDMLMIVDDRVWVPVEITMLGNGGFMDAWRYGVDEWDKLADRTEQRGFYRTSEAQSVYRPVGLREADLGLQYGSASRIRTRFEREFTQLTNIIIAEVREVAESRGGKRQYNQLGIYAARLGRYDVARDAFERAARMDATYLDPRVNLGSVYFLQDRFSQAVRAFDSAITSLNLARDPNPSLESTIYINLSKAHFELGSYDDARSYYELASAVSPETADDYRYLAQAGGGGARASEAASGPAILFADESDEE